MAAPSVNLGRLGVDSNDAREAVLTARPDMLIVNLGFLAPAFLVIAGILTYYLPLPIDHDVHVVGSGFIAGIGLVGIACLIALYDGLGKAVYTLTNEYIQEEYGIIHRRVRRIPLSYLRDVTYDQNFLQAILGISSITVSPTNGDKIVLSNIREGEKMRETIWDLVLSRSPGARSRVKLDGVNFLWAHNA